MKNYYILGYNIKNLIKIWQLKCLLLDISILIAYNVIERGDFMATKVASVSFRIDSELKNQADKLFNNLGMNLTTAFNIFLRQSVREGRIPFEITMNSPNAETISAMREAERIANDPTVKGFNSVDELMADLNE